ncbi:hypothetical protein M427DRAFT_70122 [Gonapodya prolifera JEL478]|uniref:Putative zinc-finger domain-containing protein n=1 Tax=Gonapodya prolifera (strain JEL478) TaxID=1344416 RepID=A0A139AER9_GONPJ|nr:hypothetical protein M427DRAFT_70122 [Gonapodya prolifera JEL478]|eukprot:KXS15277.1 hypothetical protein M427DRAFT_70122 [Gonapodya prolifera JEL478]
MARGVGPPRAVLSEEDRSLIKELRALGTTWDELLASGIPEAVLAGARAEMEGGVELHNESTNGPLSVGEPEEGELVDGDTDIDGRYLEQAIELDGTPSPSVTNKLTRVASGRPRDDDDLWMNDEQPDMDIELDTADGNGDGAGGRIISSTPNVINVDQKPSASPFFGRNNSASSLPPRPPTASLPPLPPISHRSTAVPSANTRPHALLTRSGSADFPIDLDGDHPVRPSMQRPRIASPSPFTSTSASSNGFTTPNGFATLPRHTSRSYSHHNLPRQPFRAQINLPPYDPKIVFEISENDDQPLVHRMPTAEPEDREAKLKMIEEQKEKMRRKIAELESKKAAPIETTNSELPDAQLPSLRGDAPKSLHSSPPQSSLNAAAATARVTAAKSRLGTARTRLNATSTEFIFLSADRDSMERSVVEKEMRVAELRAQLEAELAALADARKKLQLAEAKMATGQKAKLGATEEEAAAVELLKNAELDAARLEKLAEEACKTEAASAAAMFRKLEAQKKELKARIAARSSTNGQVTPASSSLPVKRPAPPDTAGPPAKRIANGVHPSVYASPVVGGPVPVTRGSQASAPSSQRKEIPSPKVDLPLFDQWLRAPQSFQETDDRPKPSVAQKVLSGMTGFWRRVPTVEVLKTIGGVVVHPRSHAGVLDVQRLLVKTSAKSTVAQSEIRKPVSSYPQGTNLTREERLSLIKRRVVESAIDPTRKFCLFELQGGSCNDPTCSSQHARDVDVDDDIALASFAHFVVASLKKDQGPNLVAHLQTRRNAGADPGELLSYLFAAWELVSGVTVLHLDDLPRIKRIGASGAIGSPRQPTKVIQVVTTSNPNDTEVVLDLSTDDQPSEDGLTDGGFAGPDSPFTDFLQKALRGDSTKSSRYYADSDYERGVLRNPQDAHLWITQAFESLPFPLTMELLEDRSSRVFSKSLNVLTRALQANPTSEDLWVVYLDIYCHRAKENDARGMLETSIQQAPTAYRCWWRYIGWEKDVESRKRVVERLYRVSLSERTSSSDLRSRTITDAAIKLSKLQLDSGNADVATRIVANLLLGKTVPEILDFNNDVLSPKRVVSISAFAASLSSSLLVASDWTMLCLLFFHLRWFGAYPAAVFGSPPLDFVVDRVPLLIDWRKAPQRSFQDSYLVQTTGQLFYSIVEWFRQSGPSHQRELAVMVLNAAELMGALNKSDREMLEYVDRILKETTNNVGLLGLRAQLDGPASTLGFLQQNPCKPVFWNRLVKLATEADDIPSTVVALVNCARSYFKAFPLVASPLAEGEQHKLVQEALALYRRLLGIPGQSTKSETAFLKVSEPPGSFGGDPYLHLNYVLLLVISGAGRNVVVESLQHAAESTNSEYGRQLIWQELLKLQSKMDDGVDTGVDKELLGLLGRALKEYDTGSTNPYNPDIAIENRSPLARFLPVKRYQATNELVSICAEHLPDAKLIELVNALQQQEPDNLDLVMISVRLSLEQGLKLPRAMIYNALKTFPGDSTLWRIAILLEHNSGRTQAVSKLVQAAHRFVTCADFSVFLSRFS